MKKTVGFLVSFMIYTCMCAAQNNEMQTKAPYPCTILETALRDSSVSAFFYLETRIQPIVISDYKNFFSECKTVVLNAQKFEIIHGEAPNLRCSKLQIISVRKHNQKYIIRLYDSAISGNATVVLEKEGSQYTVVERRFYNEID